MTPIWVCAHCGATSPNRQWENALCRFREVRAVKETLVIDPDNGRVLVFEPWWDGASQ